MGNLLTRFHRMGQIGKKNSQGNGLMQFRSLLVSASAEFSSEFLQIISATGACVPSMDEVIELGWECKPDTIFLDIRNANSADVHYNLNVISVSFPLSRLVVITRRGVPLDVAEELSLLADDEWDLSVTPQCSAAWLKPEHRMERPLPYEVEVSGRVLRTFSEKMLQVLRTARQVAVSRVPILLSGATGTGKSTMAQTIHAWSDRRSGPFVFFPCGAVSRDLIHAELFGHTKGAFTGATSDRVGKIEAAAGGTLLLDEVDLLSLDDQSKLLRVVETGEFERVGTVSTSRSQCRLILASNVDMKCMVDTQRFRSDLYYRINVIELEMPSLKDRIADVPLLAVACLKALAVELDRAKLRISLKALWSLRAVAWPGNIRELKNTLLRAITLMESDYLGADELRLKQDVQQQSNTSFYFNEQPQPLSALVTDASREAIVKCLRAHGNRRSTVARVLKISRSTLYRKLQEYNIGESDLVEGTGRDGPV